MSYQCLFNANRNMKDVLTNSLAKEVIFSGALVRLFVSLSMCEQHYSKRYERILMKFYGGVQGGSSD